MPITNVTAKQWSELLEKTSKLSEREDLPSLKQYIAIRRPADAKSLADYSFEVVTSDQLEGGEYTKLSLEEITSITRHVLHKDSQKSSESEVAIAEGLVRLTEAKSQRLHEARILRTALYIVSGILCLTIIGLAWGGFIISQLNAPKHEIKFAQQLIDYLRTQNPDIEKAPQIRQKRDAYFQAFDSLIQDQINPENYQKNIVEPLKEVCLSELEIAKTDLTKMSYAFQVDNERHVFHIIIKDGEMQHEAQRAAQLPENELSQFITAQFEQLKKIVGDEDKKVWLVLLETVFSQQTFTRLVGDLIGNSQSLNAWQDLGKDYYTLGLTVPLQIQTTVVRNVAGEIEKLLVEAKISTEFFHVQGEVQKAVGKTLKSEMNLEISLDKEQKPKIQVTKYHHELVS